MTAAAPGTPAMRAGAALLIVLLAGCAAPLGGPDAEQDRWRAHLAWLQGLDRWRVAGRVAVTVPGDGWSASLGWRQSGGEYRVRLGGPFGQGAIIIESDPPGVVLRTADGRVARAPSPEDLVAAELGVAVPVSALRHWLLGRPAPDPAPTRMELDWAGRLQALEQWGWEVRYRAYGDDGAGRLPSRLTVRREGMEARFVLDSWRVEG